MSRPIRGTTLSGATSAKAGDSVNLNGHNSVGLVVEADNLDTGSDTLSVQVEARVGDEWAVLRDDSGTTALTISTSEMDDPESNGNYAGFVFIHGVPVNEVRARITSFTDSAGSDLKVDAYITGANWNGPARQFREVA